MPAQARYFNILALFPVYTPIHFTFVKPFNDKGLTRKLTLVAKHINRVSAAGLLIALGIIYGDIGTSPLYVFNSIIKGRVINEELILGTLSLIIWTLTLQTT